MNDIIALNIWQFATVYILLVVVMVIMKKYRINQSKLLVIASVRMTIQLTLAGLILTYILSDPRPIFTTLYLVIMIIFALWMVFSRNKGLSKRWKMATTLSLGMLGILMVVFFITVVIGVNLFNPRYTIPLSGMIIGNAMTGVSLGIKTFNESIEKEKLKIETLINMGVKSKKILNPFISNSLETALLPTINSMMGMGIISLPGMMTGQILSGTLPTTAILYQIAIVIAVCAVTCMAVFATLYFGSKRSLDEILDME